MKDDESPSIAAPELPPGLTDFIGDWARKLGQTPPEELPDRSAARTRRRVMRRLWAHGHTTAATWVARGELEKAIDELVYDLDSEHLKKKWAPQRPAGRRRSSPPAPQGRRAIENPYDSAGSGSISGRRGRPR